MRCFCVRIYEIERYFCLLAQIKENRWLKISLLKIYSQLYT